MTDTKGDWGCECLNPYPAKLNNLNFQPLEVVSRYDFKWLKITDFCLI